MEDQGSPILTLNMTDNKQSKKGRRDVARASRLGWGGLSAPQPAGTRWNECMHVGVWNVGGLCNTDKRNEVVKIFKESRMGLLGLCEINLKGNEKFLWNDVHGVRAGMKGRERAKEGVGVLMNEEWYKALVKYECVSSRVIYVKFKFKRVKMHIVVAYGPLNDRKKEEKDKFWNELRTIVNEFGKRDKVLIMGDFNGKVGRVIREGITGRHGVGEIDENGERVVDFCSEKDVYR